MNAVSPAYLRAYARLYGRSYQEEPRQGRFDRARLPDPATYYEQALNLKQQGKNWVTAICPFHEDGEPSLSVNLNHGGFHCHACGARGGNVLDFHTQRHGLDFQAAARELGAWA